MAISAQRFKILDKQTDKATVSLSNLNSNDIFKSADSAAASISGNEKGGEGSLGVLDKDLDSMVDKLTPSKAKKLSNDISNAVDKVTKAVDPKGIAKKALDKLKNLAPAGLTSFLKKVLKIGSIFLCNNLDLMKNWMGGKDIAKNILDGLLIGLILGWLDRYCKEFNQREMAGLSNNKLVSKVLGSKGLEVTNRNFLETYKSLSSKKKKASTPYVNTKSNIPNTTNFTINIINSTGSFVPTGTPTNGTGNGIQNDYLSSLYNDLMTSELTPTEKKQYIAALEAELLLHSPGTPEYNYILEAIKVINSVPSISPDRSIKAHESSNLDASIAELVELYDPEEMVLNRSMMTDEEDTNLMEKMKEFITTLRSDPAYRGKLDSGERFTGYEIPLTTMVPNMTPEEEQAIDDQPIPLTIEEVVGRPYGLHPTTQSYIDGVTPVMKLNKVKAQERKRCKGTGVFI